MTGPIIARCDQVSELLSDISRLCHGCAEQHDAATSGQRPSARQLAEILVKGQQDPLFARGPCQDVSIARTRCRHSYPDDIVSPGRQSGYRGAGEILVGEEAHAQAALGNTLSPPSTSRAYARQAIISSCVTPG